ncbi:AHH domain-containing protein [Gilliamella sp. Pas-s25]|uniref:AHH domain-containing protein n=1 Tax=Gilliamella sp. Pas-s25 TaxID=2687310 RepID=UPI001921242F|nr:AHH domain-containing protein [Gilliamella sp. Pas-s25]
MGLTSCQLGKALEKAGVKRPENTAAHHIVPEGAKRAEPAQEILKKYEIDINSAVNGVFLPTHKNTSNLPGIMHNGRHHNDYIDAVNDRLRMADKIGTKEAIEAELKNIANILSNADRNADWKTILKQL